MATGHQRSDGRANQSQYLKARSKKLEDQLPEQTSDPAGVLRGLPRAVRGGRKRPGLSSTRPRGRAVWWAGRPSRRQFRAHREEDERRLGLEAEQVRDDRDQLIAGADGKYRTR